MVEEVDMAEEELGDVAVQLTVYMSLVQHHHRIIAILYRTIPSTEEIPDKVEKVENLWHIRATMQ